ncbi:NAD(P)H-dependent oxidoreductase [Rhodococcus sp. D2-41]|uniref:NAD(P)H-dependent oxidoreductase n=1 Tax=Speluncibacter jeojiensis TaxID=2710754 RepID=A0A9X4LXG0_9ACTN|nr:NAD(P)H-dependent oxidoreductase [Rhodococcus sp. D2-41]MDG3008672.1 NAD(P)H-dependent oxidoreductase [Rhodococcus sp. D2-41]MDG3013120.1 NAD(P)H-dependent oxidoreductase [Corynebacteriales bacterium D3-21]
MTNTRILTLVGSLRAGSVNRQLAASAVALAPEGVEASIYDGLGEIPFYNEDIDVEGQVPAAAQALRDAAAAADGFLLVTPEYNGTIPAVLKNAIDWLSRPFGAGAIVGKPVAVVGGAHGQYGGVWAQDEARKATGIAGARVLADVTFSVPGAAARFAESAPHDDADMAADIVKVLAGLAAATNEPVAVA